MINENENNVEIQHKTCSTCRLDKTIDNYRRDSHRVDGYNYSCKQCVRARQQRLYKIRYHTATKERTAKRSADCRAQMYQYKSLVGCVLCHEDTPECLDFHHTDQTTKHFSIGQGVNRSWDVVFREIQKCVVLCSNCHRKVHAKLITLLPQMPL